MRLVVATMVRDEQDILEVFLRYHARLAERVIVYLHCSTDRSAQIAASLVAEGLPIELHYDERPQYVQSELMTAAMHRAGNELAADWCRARSARPRAESSAAARRRSAFAY
jgi:hypothetical protein